MCGADGSIRLWDVETGYPKHLIMEDYRLSLTCVDRASNRQWLAQGTTTQGVQIVQIPSVSELVNILFSRIFFCFVLFYSVTNKLMVFPNFTEF